MPSLRSRLAVAFVVLVVALGLFSEQSSFPYSYHPDEPGKVDQVVHRAKNSHHPLLLLTTAEVARGALLHGEAQDDPQRVVKIDARATAAASACRSAC
jgi:hypothetical protein